MATATSSAASRSHGLHLLDRIGVGETFGKPSAEQLIGRSRFKRESMQFVIRKRAVDPVAIVPSTTARLEPSSMCWLELLDENRPKPHQLSTTAAKHNTVGLSKETINHFHEV